MSSTSAKIFGTAWAVISFILWRKTSDYYFLFIWIVLSVCVLGMAFCDFVIAWAKRRMEELNNEEIDK